MANKLLDEMAYISEAQIILLENMDYFTKEELDRRLHKMQDRIDELMKEYIELNNESSKSQS